MGLTEVVLVVLGVAAAVCVSVLRARTRVLVALLLAVPQVYVTVAGFDVPLYVCWTMLSLPAALLAFRGALPARGVCVGVLAIAVLYAGYAPFAVDGRQSLYFAVFYLCFLSGLLDAATAIRENDGLHDLLRAVQPAVLVQCLLVAVFRLDPQLEREFLRSRLLSVFAGEVAAKGLFRGSPNNVLDVDKAGGFFVNGNVASMFLGVAACVALWQWSRSRRRTDLLVAVVALLSVVFTGSKTGMVLAVAGLVVVVFSAMLVRSAASFLLAVLLWALGAGAVVLTLGDVVWGSDLGQKSVLTLSIRQHIWHAAWRFFESSPLTGLTTGGWERSFSAVAGSTGIGFVYPPHNFVIAAWAHCGLLGALLVVGVSGAWVYRAASVLRQGRDLDRVTVAGRAALLCAVAWPIVHSLGDNTSVYGDLHSQVLVAVMIATTFHTENRTGLDAGSAPAPPQLQSAPVEGRVRGDGAEAAVRTTARRGPLGTSGRRRDVSVT